MPTHSGSDPLCIKSSTSCLALSHAAFVMLSSSGCDLTVLNTPAHPGAPRQPPKPVLYISICPAEPSSCPCYTLHAVGVTFKDLKPQPIPLHPGSPQSLFNSVFYFQSTLNRTKDWAWPSDATPKRMDHWMVLDQRSAAGRPQLWVPEDKLADGWYNLRVSHPLTIVVPWSDHSMVGGERRQ